MAPKSKVCHALDVHRDQYVLGSKQLAFILLFFFSVVSDPCLGYPIQMVLDFLERWPAISCGSPSVQSRSNRHQEEELHSLHAELAKNLASEEALMGPGSVVVSLGPNG